VLIDCQSSSSTTGFELVIRLRVDHFFCMIRVFLMLLACLLLSGCIPFVPIVQQQPAPLMPAEEAPHFGELEMLPEQSA
jgi:hypothetical protein